MHCAEHPPPLPTDNHNNCGGVEVGLKWVKGCLGDKPQDQ